jgi:two-component system response regulator HydG
MDRLLRHPWPGNVRELMNAVERGVVLSLGEYLDEAELALLLPETASAAAPEALPPPAATVGTTSAPWNAATAMTIPGGAAAIGKAGTATPGAETASLEEVERETILRTLTASGGNKSEAARRLGITRRTLHQKLRKYGMM